MHNSRFKIALLCMSCVVLIVVYQRDADARLFELFKLLFLIVGMNQFLCLMARETDFMAAAS